MNHFEQISGALQYIDSHLAEPVTLAMLAEQCHFSPFYFHRLFTAVVGKSLAAYIRDRKILHACRLLAETDRSMLDIALDSGFQSAQAFSRAFRDSQGMSAREYRRQGCRPVVVTAEELIVRFTNRLRGGVLVNPMLIRRGPLRIAGTCGDGSRTGEVWQRFMRLREEKPLTNAASESGYEVRLYQGGGCTVHVGQCVSSGGLIRKRITAWSSTTSALRTATASSRFGCRSRRLIKYSSRPCRTRGRNPPMRRRPPAGSPAGPAPACAPGHGDTPGPSGGGRGP